MSQSHTLDIGGDVHTDAMAVASVAPEHGAEVISLGAIGTRPCDLAQRLRPRPAQATPLLLIYEAGPCGAWLSRSFTNTGDDGWGVAPSRVPQKAGDRGTTDRRDARPRARRARSGDLPGVEVPHVDEEARRDLTRAREATLSALQDATFRLHACWLRHDLRSPGRATWSPAHRRWLSAVVCPTPAPHLVWQA
jgi:transposase